LKTRFEVWFARYSQSEVVQEDKSKEFKKSKERPLLKGNGKNGGRSARPIEEDLSEAHYERVLTYVSERKLVDINQVLTDLGDQSLKTAVLRAVERTPKIKAHPCPQTIYLQWRLVE
jgi:hypothetical protein